MSESQGTKRRWFWPWQDEKEEAWLTGMASQGAHLIKVESFGRYCFAQGEPGDVAYRLDYTPLKKQDREGYIQVFADAGWEFVCEKNNWQYFRKGIAADGQAEIFSDNESKIARLKRLQNQLLSLLPVWMVLYVAVTQSNTGRNWLIFAGALFFGVLFFYVILMLKISARIKRLRQF